MSPSRTIVLTVREWKLLTRVGELQGLTPEKALKEAFDRMESSLKLVDAGRLDELAAVGQALRDVSSLVEKEEACSHLKVVK